MTKPPTPPIGITINTPPAEALQRCASWLKELLRSDLTDPLTEDEVYGLTVCSIEVGAAAEGAAEQT
jgi:hypothetical protein